MTYTTCALLSDYVQYVTEYTVQYVTSSLFSKQLTIYNKYLHHFTCTKTISLT